MKLIDKIYNTEPLSKREIKLYLKDKLSDSDKNKIEQKLMNSKFNNDAFEGYVANNILPKKNNFLHNQNLNFILSFSILITTIVLSFILVDKTQNQVNPNIKISQKNIIEQKQETKEILNINNKQLSNNNKTVTKKTKTIKPIKNNKFYEYLPVIKPKTVKQLNKVKIKNNVNLTNIKLRSNFKTKYLVNLKIVDYSLFKRTNNLTKNNNDIWNVAPEFANNYEQNIKTKNIKSIEYTYFDFLKSGLQEFNDKNYNNAIDDFEIILSQYDNDLNAVFYSGLSYYFKNNYSKAIKYFNIAINADINVFYQEALWYKALSEENIDKQKCKQILKTIINENGFYAEKAKQKLKKINE